MDLRKAIRTAIFEGNTDITSICDRIEQMGFGEAKVSRVQAISKAILKRVKV